MDVLTPEQRHKNMKSIRGRKTKLEQMIAQGLHAMGFRYRLNVSSLAGSPDLVFPKYHAVIFAHGCFWHGHNCHLFKIPATRTEFWLNKITSNQHRDKRDMQSLIDLNWRVMIVWECAIRGRTKRPLQDVLEDCQTFLFSDERQYEVRGHPRTESTGGDI